MTRQEAFDEAVAKHRLMCWLDEAGTLGWRGWKAATAVVWAAFIPDYYRLPEGTQLHEAPYRRRLYGAVWQSCLAQDGSYDVMEGPAWAAFQTTINDAVYAAKPTLAP